MTDLEHTTRLRVLLIDAKDRLYTLGLTRHDALIQRIYAGLAAEQRDRQQPDTRRLGAPAGLPRWKLGTVWAHHNLHVRSRRTPGRDPEPGGGRRQRGGSVMEWTPDHVCPRKPLKGSPVMQYVEDTKAKEFQVMCSACAERWRHPDSDMLWMAWARGFVVGKARAVDAAMSVAEPDMERWY